MNRIDKLCTYSKYLVSIAEALPKKLNALSSSTDSMASTLSSLVAHLEQAKAPTAAKHIAVCRINHEYHRIDTGQSVERDEECVYRNFWCSSGIPL